MDKITRDKFSRKAVEERDWDAGLGNLFCEIIAPDDGQADNWDAWEDEINRALDDDWGIGELEEIPLPLKIAG